MAVGVGLVLLALDITALLCDVVCAGGAMGRLGIAVGTVISTLWLDKKDATTPPTLCRMLLICLRCWGCLRVAIVVPRLPAD
jgi:hypothetical protein